MLLTAKGLLVGEAPALRVREAQPLVTELLSQHAVLLLEILDGRELPSVDPAADAHQQEVQGCHLAHAATLARSWAPTEPSPTVGDRAGFRSIDFRTGRDPGIEVEVEVLER